MRKPPELKAHEGHPNARLTAPSVKGSGVPTKPRGLGQHAAKLWDKIIPQLTQLGIATELDQSALEALVFWWQVFCESREQLDNADYSTTATGRIVQANSRAWDNFRRLAEQFGMTPMARTGLTVAKPTEDDIADLFTR